MHADSSLGTIQYQPQAFKRLELGDLDCDYEAMFDICNNLKNLQKTSNLSDLAKINLNIAQAEYINQIRLFNSLVEFEPCTIKNSEDEAELKQAIMPAVLGAYSLNKGLGRYDAGLAPHHLNILVNNRTIYFFCSITESLNLLDTPSLKTVNKLIKELESTNKIQDKVIKYRFSPSVEQKIEATLDIFESYKPSFERELIDEKEPYDFKTDSDLRVFLEKNVPNFYPYLNVKFINMPPNSVKFVRESNNQVEFEAKQLDGKALLKESNNLKVVTEAIQSAFDHVACALDHINLDRDLAHKRTYVLEVCVLRSKLYFFVDFLMADSYVKTPTLSEITDFILLMDEAYGDVYRFSPEVEDWLFMYKRRMTEESRCE